MYKTLTIKNGSTNVLVATTNPDADPEAIVIIEVEGWEEEIVTIETEPKLIGAGSYIVAERVEQKDIGFTFNLVSGVRNNANALKSLALSFTNLTFQVQYFNDGSTSALGTEVLNGKLTSVDIPNGYKDWGNIQIQAVCVNPIKV